MFSSSSGLDDWNDTDVLTQVLAASQQEYLNSLKAAAAKESESRSRRSSSDSSDQEREHQNPNKNNKNNAS